MGWRAVKVGSYGKAPGRTERGRVGEPGATSPTAEGAETVADVRFGATMELVKQKQVATRPTTTTTRTTVGGEVERMRGENVVDGSSSLKEEEESKRAMELRGCGAQGAGCMHLVGGGGGGDFIR